ncbi:hypothetical protein ACFLRF_00815 [Candidatus Altiarchaeota archaeon]
MAKKWDCRLCGKPTEDAGKVCLVCKTDTTQVKGYVDKKDLKKD